MSDQGGTPSLPPNAILLHAGLPKTGSTALQSVASAKRPELLEHGVLYPGAPRPFHSVAFVSFMRSVSKNPKDRARIARGGLKVWANLLREVRAEQQRRVWLSSESVTGSDLAQATAIAEQLGDRLNVVITLRPLGDRMMSLWQQRVRRGATRVGLDEWMRQVLPEQVGGTPSQIARKYLDFYEKVQRWVDAVGAERVTVVVVDKANPDQLYRSFEQLLDLPTGMLDLTEQQRAETRSNRGMTPVEIEFARRVSVAAKEFGLDDSDYRRLLHRGAFARIQYRREPGRDEGRLQLSPWAAERLTAAAASSIERIEAMGIRIMGDLHSLVEEPRTGDEPELDTVPLDAAVTAMIGALAVATEKDPVAPKTRAAKPVGGRPARAKSAQGSGGAKSGAAKSGAAKSGAAKSGAAKPGAKSAGSKSKPGAAAPGAKGRPRARRAPRKPPSFLTRVRRRVARLLNR